MLVEISLVFIVGFIFTEFNTAHNRRITMIGIPEEGARKKPRKIRLTFNEEECVINPEDVDPSIGR